MYSKLFTEISQHLMEDNQPSKFIKRLLRASENNVSLENLSKLREIKQNPKYHPEGSVFNHVMEVVDHAAKVKHKSLHPQIFMWAALLHDIGKLTTTKVRKGRITAYGHDEKGALLAKTLLEVLMDDEKFIEEVVYLVRWHMQPFYVVKNLPFGDIKTMISETSASEVALLSLCDRMGRGALTRQNIEDAIDMEVMFLDKCRHYMRNQAHEGHLENMAKYLRDNALQDVQ